MYTNYFKPFEIILASNSIRRKQMFEDAKIPFTLQKLNVNEVFDSKLEGANISDYLVKLKADAFKKQLEPNHILITADTIVWRNKQYLGKPKTKTEASKMLTLLSGKKHDVITSVAFTQPNKQKVIHEISNVTFRDLSRNEIEYYVETFNPLDKAGSYGIQEWIGSIGVEQIQGSYTNIIGLPMSQVIQTLKSIVNSKAND